MYHPEVSLIKNKTQNENENCERYPRSTALNKADLFILAVWLAFISLSPAVVPNMRIFFFFLSILSTPVGLNALIWFRAKLLFVKGARKQCLQTVFTSACLGADWATTYRWRQAGKAQVRLIWRWRWRDVYGTCALTVTTWFGVTHLFSLSS